MTTNHNRRRLEVAVETSPPRSAEARLPANTSRALGREIIAQAANQEEPPNPKKGHPPTDPKKLRQAIVDYANGTSMKQASLNQGFSPSWLSNWCRRYPEESGQIYAEISGGREKPNPPKKGKPPTDPKKLRQAIVDYANGTSMKQASLNQGFNRGWLSSWCRDHPEDFDQIYAEISGGQGSPEVKRGHPPTDPKKLRRAIVDYANGTSMRQASLNQGFNQNWLSSWCRRYPEEFDQIHAEISGGREKPNPPKKGKPPTDPKKLRQAIVDYANGTSMRQASLNQGFSRNWLSMWCRNHPEEFDQIHAEVKSGSD